MPAVQLAEDASDGSDGSDGTDGGGDDTPVAGESDGPDSVNGEDPDTIDADPVAGEEEGPLPFTGIALVTIGLLAAIALMLGFVSKRHGSRKTKRSSAR